MLYFIQEKLLLRLDWAVPDSGQGHSCRAEGAQARTSALHSSQLLPPGVEAAAVDTLLTPIHVDAASSSPGGDSQYVEAEADTKSWGLGTHVSDQKVSTCANKQTVFSSCPPSWMRIKASFYLFIFVSLSCTLYSHLMGSAFTAERPVLCLHITMHLTQYPHQHTHGFGYETKVEILHRCRGPWEQQSWPMRWLRACQWREGSRARAGRGKIACHKLFAANLYLQSGQ